MSTPLELHNAARRYCTDRFAYWSSAYQKLYDKGKTNFESAAYSDDAAAASARLQALSAILIEIERIDADDLPEYSDLSDLLILAGQIAENDFTGVVISEIHTGAIQDERGEFIEAVRRLTPESVAALPALPYRRVLSTAEIGSLREPVAARWGGSYGRIYPLAERSDSSLRAYDDEAFDKEFPAGRLQSILRSRGVERVYELREYGEKNYLMSIECWEPCYGLGGEGTWFSDALDWVMFWSHEGSVTTGGALTDSIVSEWKDVDSHAPWFFDSNHPWFP